MSSFFQPQPDAEPVWIGAAEPHYIQGRTRFRESRVHSLLTRTVRPKLVGFVGLLTGMAWCLSSAAPPNSLHGPRGPTATTRPLEIWNFFSPEDRPTYAAIDQWIVDRYNTGTHGDIVTVLGSLMSSTGNTEAKNLASSYVIRSKRWELARFLIPAVNATTSTSSARFNALAAVRGALAATGIQFFAPSDKIIIQNYVSSGQEVYLDTLTTAQNIVNRMTQLGL